METDTTNSTINVSESFNVDWIEPLTIQISGLSAILTNVEPNTISINGLPSHNTTMVDGVQYDLLTFVISYSDDPNNAKAESPCSLLPNGPYCYTPTTNNGVYVTVNHASNSSNQGSASKNYGHGGRRFPSK